MSRNLQSTELGVGSTTVQWQNANSRVEGHCVDVQKENQLLETARNIGAWTKKMFTFASKFCCVPRCEK